MIGAMLKVHIFGRDGMILGEWGKPEDDARKAEKLSLHAALYGTCRVCDKPVASMMPERYRLCEKCRMKGIKLD